MSALTEYSVNQPPTSNTYYTIWDTYCSSLQRATPSYAVLQAKKQRLPGVYPMDWDFQRARTLVDNIKDDHSQQKTKARQDEVESSVRKKYSQQLFDHALKDISTNSIGSKRYAACGIKEQNRPNTTGTSGPTRHGSPIYNKRANLLNRIRVQTATARLNSDSKTIRKTNATILENIENYNQVYQLVHDKTRKAKTIFNGTNMRFVEKSSVEATSAASIGDESEEETENEVQSDQKDFDERNHLVDAPELVIDEPELIVERPELTVEKPELVIDAPTHIGNVPQVLVDVTESQEVKKEGSANKKEDAQIGALLNVNKSLRPMSARSAR